MDKGRADGIFDALFTAFLDMRGRVGIYSCLFQFFFVISLSFLRVSTMQRDWRVFMKYGRYLYQDIPKVHYI
jgi:hypothetical protein